jgi:hypothetical protein
MQDALPAAAANASNDCGGVALGPHAALIILPQATLHPDILIVPEAGIDIFWNL